MGLSRMVHGWYMGGSWIGSYCTDGLLPVYQPILCFIPSYEPNEPLKCRKLRDRIRQQEEGVAKVAVHWFKRFIYDRKDALLTTRNSASRRENVTKDQKGASLSPSSRALAAANGSKFSSVCTGCGIGLASCAIRSASAVLRT